MVPGSGRCISSRLIPTLAVALILAACAPGSEATDTSTAAGATTTITSATITSTTSTTRPSPTSTVSPGTSEPVPDFDFEIRVPGGEGPFPAAVLVHGGGWVAGSPALMDDLAAYLTEEGYLTLSAPYTLANGTAGFPAAVDDIACAVRHVAAHPDGDGTVAVIGHSAGAHLAALVALDEGTYGTGCPLVDPVIPDRLVGLAGPYDVARLGPLIGLFFGVGPSDDPELWIKGNPLFQAGNNPDLSSLIMHGEEDGLVSFDFATDFSAALTEAGTEAVVEVVEGARHNDMHDPDVVGDLIVTWLERG
ncbi:MAG: alpha/beta hydrolase [Acidimicrobiia bacterium]